MSIFSGFLHGLDFFFTLLILFVKFARCTANSVSIFSGFHDGLKLFIFHDVEFNALVSMYGGLTHCPYIRLFLTLLIVFVEFARRTPNSVSICSGRLHGLKLVSDFLRCPSSNVWWSYALPIHWTFHQIMSAKCWSKCWLPAKCWFFTILLLRQVRMYGGLTHCPYIGNGVTNLPSA